MKFTSCIDNKEAFPKGEMEQFGFTWNIDEMRGYFHPLPGADIPFIFQVPFKPESPRGNMELFISPRYSELYEAHGRYEGSIFAPLEAILV